jgi:hypothetical protein
MAAPLKLRWDEVEVFHFCIKIAFRNLYAESSPAGLGLASSLERTGIAPIESKYNETMSVERA